MKSGWKAAAALALGLIGSQAGAAPLQFDCDAPAGNFSKLAQAAGLAPYRISGRVTPLAARPLERWQPTAGVRVLSADGKRRAMLLLMPAAPGGTSFAVRALKIVDGREETVQLGSLLLNQGQAFAIEVTAAGVRIAAGEGTADLAVAIGPGASVEAVCSTGEFLFDGLDLGGSR